ncbi:MAG: hypothetical protein ACW99A_10505 [Candidatus Kariarchaeaceae archaeon]
MKRTLSASDFKGVADGDSTWERFAGELVVTSYTWDTSTIENGDYSLSIEIFSTDLSEHVVFDGIITISNSDTISSDTDTSKSADSFISFNVLNVAIFGLIITAVSVHRRKSYVK